MNKNWLIGLLVFCGCVTRNELQPILKIQLKFNNKAVNAFEVISNRMNDLESKIKFLQEKLDTQITTEIIKDKEWDSQQQK